MKTAKLPEHMLIHPNHLNGNACYTCACGQWHHNGSEKQATAAYKRHELRDTPKWHKEDSPAVERDSRSEETHDSTRWMRIERLAADRNMFRDAIAGPENTLYRLDLLTSIIEEAEAERYAMVERARRHGASWTKIGQHVGRTKQAAQMRYGKKTAPATDPAQLTID